MKEIMVFNEVLNVSTNEVLSLNNSCKKLVMIKDCILC